MNEKGRIKHGVYWRMLLWCTMSNRRDVPVATGLRPVDLGAAVHIREKKTAHRAAATVGCGVYLTRFSKVPEENADDSTAHLRLCDLSPTSSMSFLAAVSPMAIILKFLLVAPDIREHSSTELIEKFSR